MPVDDDGKFRIAGVLPAHYQLFVSSDDNSVYRVHQLSVPADAKAPEINMGEIAVAQAAPAKAAAQPVQSTERPNEKKNAAKPKPKASVVQVSGKAVDAITGQPN